MNDIHKAMEKARMMKGMRKQAQKMGMPQNMEAREGRTMEVMSEELGPMSAKTGPGDVLKGTFMARVIEKSEGKFTVRMDSIDIPEQGAKQEFDKPIISPSG